ncbi:alpha/beta fold hydrolase [Luteococcus sp. Sow4_B9]|uniref:alpha/beta fold hydrolase n=1 Tax=Luteococcus sp. Sow4_B9 TaxID=3438792 RepID=UPI003F9C0776
MQYKRIGIWRSVRWIAAGLVLALAIGQLVSLVRPEARVGHWKSADAQSRYATAHAEVMATLPASDEMHDVPTRFGAVRTVMWRGKAAGRPVLLLPGHSSGAAMWAENLPSWIGKRTVYALDPLGDAGFSAQHTPLTSPSDQAAWIADVINGLGIGPVHVVGHSFGGANAAILAVEHPELVASLALEEPVAVIQPLPASIYLWSAMLLLPTPRAWKDHALARIGGTSVEEVRRRTSMSVMIDAASNGFSTALPAPGSLTDEQWRSLTMPVRVDLGGASTLAGGEESAHRLRTLLPGAHVTVWPEGTHSLPMQRREELGGELLHFWGNS